MEHEYHDVHTTEHFLGVRLVLLATSCNFTSYCPQLHFVLKAALSAAS